MDRRPRPHLRHDPARRRAVARHLAERQREARDRPPARAAGRRRHRGRLPDRLAGRLRGRAGDRARGRTAPSSPASRALMPPDIERATEAVRDAERPRIHTFISTSDIHIEHQLQSTREDVKGQARAAVAHARSLVEDVEFSPMDATRADVEFTAEVVQIAIDEGATTINVPDTVGYAMPDEYAAFLARLYELVPGLRDVVLSVHCHDDLGLAVANSLAGVQAGARQVECAINGIGERAGNASLEEIVMLLHTRAADLGYTTGINTREIARTSRMVSRLTGYPVQPNKAIVGPQRVRARVRHPPGRRAQGPLDLRDHGRDDGRARRQPTRARQALRPPRAARARWRSWASRSTGQALNTAFKRFKEIADKKKQVTAMDLEALVTDELRDELRSYTLEWFDVEASSRRPPHATVSLRTPDGTRSCAATSPATARSTRSSAPSTRRHAARGAPARVPHRRGDGRPGRARRGERRARARGPVGVRPGRLDRHHRGGRAGLRARALQRRAARARRGRGRRPPRRPRPSSRRRRSQRFRAIQISSTGHDRAHSSVIQLEARAARRRAARRARAAPSTSKPAARSSAIISPWGRWNSTEGRRRRPTRPR